MTMDKGSKLTIGLFFIINDFLFKVYNLTISFNYIQFDEKKKSESYYEKPSFC